MSWTRLFVFVYFLCLYNSFPLVWSLVRTAWFWACHMREGSVQEVQSLLTLWAFPVYSWLWDVECVLFWILQKGMSVSVCIFTCDGVEQCQTSRVQSNCRFWPVITVSLRSLHEERLSFLQCLWHCFHEPVKLERLSNVNFHCPGFLSLRLVNDGLVWPCFKLVTSQQVVFVDAILSLWFSSFRVLLEVRGQLGVKGHKVIKQCSIFRQSLSRFCFLHVMALSFNLDPYIEVLRLYYGTSVFIYYQSNTTFMVMRIINALSSKGFWWNNLNEFFRVLSLYIFKKNKQI